MNVEKAKAISNEVIRLNDIKMSKLLPIATSFIWEQIEKESNKGYQSYNFMLDIFFDEIGKTGEVFTLNGPGQRKFIKALKKVVKDAGFKIGNKDLFLAKDCERPDRFTIIWY